MSENKPSKKDIHKVIAALDIPKKEKKEAHDFLKDLSDKEYESLNSSIKAVTDELINRGIIPPKTARKEAEAISEGEEEPHHIGKHTPETLTQELFSLQNTKISFRGKKWHARYGQISAKIANIKDPRVREGIQNKARAMLQGGEI